MDDPGGQEAPKTTCTRTLTNARIARQLNAEEKLDSIMGNRGEERGPSSGSNANERHDHVAAPSTWARVHRDSLPLQGFKTRGQLLAARGAPNVRVAPLSASADAPAANGEAQPIRGILSTGLRDNGSSPGGNLPPRRSPASHSGIAMGAAARRQHLLSSPALSQLPRFAGSREDEAPGRGMSLGGQGDKALFRNSRRRLLSPEKADGAGPGWALCVSGTAVQSESPVEKGTARPSVRSLGESLSACRRSLFEDRSVSDRETKSAGVRAEKAEGEHMEEAGGPDEHEADTADGRAEDAGDDEDEQEEQAHAFALGPSPAGSAEEAAPQELPFGTPGASVDARAGIAHSLGIPTRNGSPLPARDASQVVQQLPQGFRPLETMYGALEVACKLLRTRRQMCTLHHLAPIVAEITHRRFLDTHVAQMLYVVPHILTVEPVLRQRSDSSPVSSNSRLSRFGASQWDLNISLAQPPLRSSLDQQAVAAGPAAEAGNDSAFTNVGWPSQRLGKHDGGGVPGLGGSGSTLLASESKDPAHARTGVEALQGNQSSGASQEVKRRRLFPQEADTTGLSREPQGLRPVAEHGVVEGGEGGVRGAGAMRRLSDAEAMVWRKREFRRALQDLHRSMPLLQDVPLAPLPVPLPGSAEPKETRATGVSQKARSSPVERGQDLVGARAGEELSPVPVCRNLVGGGRRLFSPPEDGRGVQGLRVAGEEGEPGQAPEAGDAMGLGGTQQEAQAVTPPASPKHRQRPPGSITKGPGAEPDLGERCRLSLTPVFQRQPQPAGSLRTTETASGCELAHPQSVAPMTLHPLLQADGATRRGEEGLLGPREPRQPTPVGSRMAPWGPGGGLSLPQGMIELHPLLRADCQESGRKEGPGGGPEGTALPLGPSTQRDPTGLHTSQVDATNSPANPGPGCDEAEDRLVAPSSTAVQVGPGAEMGVGGPREAGAKGGLEAGAKGGLGAGTGGGVMGLPEGQLDADGAGILGSLPPDLIHAVQLREEQKRRDGREEEVQRRKRQRLLGELPMAADALATVFASSKVAVLSHRDIVAAVASSRAQNMNQIEIEQQLSLLVELFPQWLTVKVSSRGENLYRINKSFPLSTVRPVVAAERRKLGSL